MCAHACTCDEELRVRLLITAFLPSSPLPPRHPAARIPRPRTHIDAAAERRIHQYRAAAPPPPRSPS